MNKIIIRRYKKEDIPVFYEAVSESKKEVAKWLPWCHDKYTIEETEQWINEMVPQKWQSKKGYEFVMVNNSKEKIVGGCGLEQIDWKKKEASIGYWVRTSETSQGLATKACFFLLEFGFEELKLERIKVIPSAENIPSVKVAQKLPYVETCKVENGFQVGNQVSDALVFVITKKSYEDGLDFLLPE